MINKIMSFLIFGMTFKNVIGVLLIITGIFDAWKYTWQAKKIQSVGTAKGHSRKFINMAITNDLIRITYSILIKDLYLVAINTIAMSCMINLWIIIYLYYPYRRRGLINFKRPNLILYFWNSITPNSIRKRL